MPTKDENHVAEGGNKRQLRRNSLSRRSLIPFQLAPVPMRFFPLRVELRDILSLQCPHDPDPGKHRRSAASRYQDQRLHRRLPFRRRVLFLRQGGNVLAGVELASAESDRQS